MAEIMWTIDHEADIASDLSAFHRIDDAEALDAPRYFSLAIRLSAYAGVMAARVMAASEESREPVSAAHSAARAASLPERPMIVDDETAIAMLVADGWAERG